MTYRDELEADRARIEALERENAELHAEIDGRNAPKPDPKEEPPAWKPPRKVARWPFLGAFWGAFMLSMAGTAIVPVSMRLAAPVVCSKGYSRSVVVLHVRGTSRGGTSYSGQLYCVFPDKHQFPEPVGTFPVLGVLFAGWLVIAMAGAGLHALTRPQKLEEEP